MDFSSTEAEFLKALDAIAGINGVPHCLFPLLAKQNLFVPLCNDVVKNGILSVYTAAGRQNVDDETIDWQVLSVREVSARVNDEGLNGFVIDCELPRRLLVCGDDFKALENSISQNSAGETIEYESGVEMILATPSEMPSKWLLTTLQSVISKGCDYNAAWLFEIIMPETSEGELCIGIEPTENTDFSALEEAIDSALKDGKLEFANYHTLGFLALREPELVELVRSVGIQVDGRK